ncbi:MAG TPA: hypothetical protein VFV87_21330 [Pirellulaceae bacterium]|nr:hypothetical protein [Pirellulaceae bacterium]
MTLLAVACLLGVGCGDGGPKLNRVSGKITFKGAPVPAGTVYIRPDTAQGNSGPAGIAYIKDGVYDTSSSGGKGSVSGPVVMSVDGLDPTPPPNAGPDVTVTSLFSSYETKAEIKAPETVHDIDVPPEAAQVPSSGETTGGAIVP